MADYYQILGVSRSASKDEIGKAYRTLAKKYHPDLHPDDKNAKAKFQELQQAFEVLNDEQKRKQYDQFGPDFEKFQGGAGGFHEGFSGGGFQGGFPGGGSFRDGFSGGGTWNFDINDLFGGGNGSRGGFDSGDFFSGFRGRDGRGTGRRQRAQTKGRDLQHSVSISFEESVLGTEADVTIRKATGDSKTVTAKIQAGIEDGQKLRLRGLGEKSIDGGPAGDLVLTVHVREHSSFTRKGNDLFLALPVTISEAALGAKVTIPTPKGEGALNIPAGTSSGKKLRIKGAGVQAKSGPGDLYVEIQVNVPKNISQEEGEFLRSLDKKYESGLRSGITW